MTSRGSKSRIKWEGDSNAIIRSWPVDVRQDFGLELTRLENNEEPLDSKPMGKTLPGVSELRGEDRDFWYRVLYFFESGWIYILHCFTKKTNETSQGDIAIAKRRLTTVKERADYPFREEKRNAEGTEKKRIR